MKSWTCGDCKAMYPMSVYSCTRPFDDYLALHGGSIDSAISRAVDRAIAPLLEQALNRLNPPRWRVITNKKFTVQEFACAS